MKKVLFFILASIFAISQAFLVEAAHEVSVSNFIYSPTLMLAIIVGIIASSLTLLNARMLSGDLKNSYLFLGIGMFSIVIGFILVAFPLIHSRSIAMVLHDLSFIAGYGLILFSALKFSSIISSLKRRS